MLKSFFKERLADFVMLLPWGARDAIKDRLIDEVGRYDFCAREAIEGR